MRILYCTPESPLIPAGGIGTYVDLAVQAMQAAGHEVFLLTWCRPDQTPKMQPDWLKASNIRVVRIDPQTVWDRFPAGPWVTAMSQLLLEYIERAVLDWKIDVVESTDYLFPAYAFFQKARTHPSLSHVVLSAFNHGLNAESYRANAMMPDRMASDDLCSERQLMRLADVVLSPSDYAVGMLRAYGVDTPTVLVPEPFQFERRGVPADFDGRFVHLGRVSYAKGIDNLAFLINQCQGEIDLREVYLIGSVTETTFRETGSLPYFTKRLRVQAPLEVVATGNLDREDALDLLSPADFVCSLSRSETFSYSTLEGLDAGAGVLAQVGTAVAELFPPDMGDYLLPKNLCDQPAVLAVMERWLRDKRSATARLIAYNEARSGPRQFADRVEAAYQPLIDRKGPARPVKPKAMVKTGKGAKPPVDPRVSILIPAYKPGPEFAETLDSLANQTLRPGEVLICDDGSPDGIDEWVEYGRSAGLNIRVVRQANCGLLGARNTLIANCASDLAIFLDCDDLLRAEALETFLTAYETSGQPDAIICQRQNFGESTERVIRHHLNDHSLLNTNDYRMTSLLKTAVLREIGFDGMRRNGEGDDWIFWLEFSDRGLRAEFIPEALFEYRFYRGSMSWPWSMGQSAATADMIAELVGRKTEGGRLAKLIRWAVYDAMGERYHAQLHR